MNDEKTDRYSNQEAQRRFDAALRGARVVGHKPMSELRIGKVKASRGKSPGAGKRKAQAAKQKKGR